MPTIKELRRGRGWSQAHLAEQAGVSARTIHRIEKGQSVMPIVLKSVTNALGVRPGDVTGVLVVNRVLDRRG
jgi:transcriptional regulator with XRE-family HTH domain